MSERLSDEEIQNMLIYGLDVAEENDVLSMAHEIKERRASEPKWIDVKDGLPKNGRIVIFFASGEPRAGSYQDYAKQWSDGTRAFPSPTVTHWMPLPQLPKAK